MPLTRKDAVEAIALGVGFAILIALAHFSTWFNALPLWLMGVIGAIVFVGSLAIVWTLRHLRPVRDPRHKALAAQQDLQERAGEKLMQMRRLFSELETKAADAATRRTLLVELRVLEARFKQAENLGEQAEKAYEDRLRADIRLVSVCGGYTIEWSQQSIDGHVQLMTVLDAAIYEIRRATSTSEEILRTRPPRTLFPGPDGE